MSECSDSEQRESRVLGIIHNSLPLESLKPLSDLLSEDPRFREMMTAGSGADDEYDDEEDDEEGWGRGLATYTLEQHYERFSTLTPPAGAPIEIVNGFVTAQHLAIYAWFVFPFSVVAELQALTTLEHALRRRMHGEPPRGLKLRLRHAIAQGWLKGEHLRKIDMCLVPTSPLEFSNRPVDPDGHVLLQTLVENLPEERNWLAHGNFRLEGEPFVMLDTVLQLINQLYPTRQQSA